jgi:hypothetical protein
MDRFAEGLTYIEKGKAIILQACTGP